MDPSGIRLGTPAVTTRGLGAEHMADLGRWIDDGIEAADARTRPRSSAFAPTSPSRPRVAAPA
jgi:glycine hydroxymethyltransferase